jgi:hypothetical protein
LAITLVNKSSANMSSASENHIIFKDSLVNNCVIMIICIIFQDIGIGSYSVCKRCVHRLTGNSYAVKVNITYHLYMIIAVKINCYIYPLPYSFMNIQKLKSSIRKCRNLLKLIKWLTCKHLEYLFHIELKGSISI